MNNVTVSTKSQQTVVTPRDFLGNVCKIWPCAFDLAATQENKRFAGCYTPEDDSLSMDWSKTPIAPDKYLWLNPPFKSTDKWMEKCATESKKGCKIVTLTLSSCGTRWYHKYVRPNAFSLKLLSRVQFENYEYIYPKELMINVFAHNIIGEGYWDWRKATIK